MFCYCFKCKKNTESKSPKLVKTKAERIMLSSSCAICSSKNSRLIKEQKTIRLFSRL